MYVYRSCGCAYLRRWVNVAVRRPRVDLAVAAKTLSVSAAPAASRGL